MIITSKNNPLVKETASLKEKKGRRELLSFLVEGEKMVRECLQSDLEVEKIFVSESYKGTPFPDAIVLSDDAFSALSDEKTPQGVICRVKISKFPFAPPTSPCLLLDGVSDPGNMGAILRTANATGFREVYCVGCTDPYAPKSVRASMSGIFHEKICLCTHEEAFSLLKNVPVLMADMDGENVFRYSAPEIYALAIGNEANGISDEVERFSTARLSIPMENGQESLNAAVAAGIAMYALKSEKFKKM